MNIQQIMKQAQEMQKKMQEMQENIAKKEYEGQSGGGLVKLVLTGKGIVKNIDISAELLKPEEKEVLEDLVAAAFNDTKHKIEDALKDEMSDFAGAMGLPADFNANF